MRQNREVVDNGRSRDQFGPAGPEVSTSAAWRSPAVRDQAKGQRVAGDPILKLEARHGTDSSQTPRWREQDSNHRFRGRRPELFYPSIRVRPVARCSLTVWRRVCHRALRCGPPACGGKARRRHGWGERPCMRQRFPVASCRLPTGDGGTKGGATYRFGSETAMLAWSGSP